jgi:hypothetical protein
MADSVTLTKGDKLKRFKVYDRKGELKLHMQVRQADHWFCTNKALNCCAFSRIAGLGCHPCVPTCLSLAKWDALKG